MDPRLEQVLRDFQRELTRHDRDLDTLKRAARTPQLGHSSIESGALEVRDPESGQRMRIGIIDGRVGTTTEGGDPVDAPSAPVVTPSLGGLRVTWDGTLAGDVAIPVDFDHMAVHVSTTSGFEPSAATYQGSIRRAGEGGMLPVVPLPYVEHYVVLVPVTTGGVQGAPSAEVAATPLQTSGTDLQADSVDAVHIKTGAVEAAKLEAVLALVTTIIAGIPGAARVELDQDGIRGYNTDNALIFAIDASGNAVFSGAITGSEITGSRMTIDSGTGSVGVIEDASGTVRARVTSASQARAQLAATDTQAEFSVWGDSSSPTSPVGGMIAASGVCQIAMYSDVSDSTTSPVVSLSAFADETRLSARSGSGSEVLIRSLPDYSSILLSPPAATDPDDAQTPGFLYAQRYPTDIAAVSMQGPVWTTGTGPERDRRALLHLEGARPDRTYTRSLYSARRHVFQGEAASGVIDTTTEGVIDVKDSHSILADRHAPVRGELLGSLTGYSTGSSFYDFPSGTFPSFTFKTSWSGRVRVEIMMCGLNNNSDASSIALGFRLSGGSTVPADLKRAAYVRSAGAGFGSSQSAYFSDTLNLFGNATYTLTPMYRITSGSVAYFDTALANHIIVTPLT